MTELKVYANPELKVLDLIQEKMQCKAMDRIMPWFSYLANAGIIWFALIFFLYESAQKTVGVAMMEALTMEAVICNLLLKPTVKRIRPCEIQKDYPLLIKRPKDYSFPSGHTGASFACVFVLLLFHNMLAIPFGILACLIALSRLYLYVHYPSDILAGMIIGILSAILALHMI